MCTCSQEPQASWVAAHPSICIEQGTLTPKRISGCCPAASMPVSLNCINRLQGVGEAEFSNESILRGNIVSQKAERRLGIGW